MESSLKIIILLSLITLILNLQAAELNKDEMTKRKVVSRMYQATDAALVQCPKQNIKDFEESLIELKNTYPEFDLLLKNSIYHKYAIDNYADDIKRSKTKSVEKLSSECLYIKSLLDSMVTTESGRKSVEEMVGILKK